MYCTFDLAAESGQTISCVFAVEDVKSPQFHFAECTISNLRRCDPTKLLTELLAELVRGEQAGRPILVRRNPKAMAFPRFVSGALAVVAELKDMGVNWSLLAGGGMGLNGERYVAHYSAIEPFLSYAPETRIVVDVLPDIYLLSFEGLSQFFLGQPDHLTAVFEPLFIQDSMKRGMPSFYDPRLGCPVNGHYSRRDFTSMQREFDQLESPPARELKTLSGDLTATAPLRSTAKEKDARACDPLPSFYKLKRELMSSLCEPLSISIVVRTLFKRRHLAERLLASIVRASIPGVKTEVVLSTDVDPKAAKEGLQALQSKFPMLALKLAINPAAKANEAHSRVRNLLGGAAAAGSDYIWFIDDDDYLDPEALRTLEQQVYFGVKPVFFVDTAVHNEKWDVRESGHAVVESSAYSHTWTADGWRTLFSGVNRLPVCGAIMPRDMFMRAVQAFNFRYDLSEDYILHLLMLTQSELPCFVELTGPMCHVSIRDVNENTMNVSDRTQWCVDIHGFLNDLLYGSDKLARSMFRYMPVIRVDQALAPGEVAASNARVELLDAQLRACQRQIEHLSRLALVK